MKVRSVPLLVARWGLGIGAVVVAYESALATRTVAIEAGAVHDPVTAWLTPIGIEGLAASFVALRLHLEGAQDKAGKRRARGVLIAAALFGALAVWVNVAAVSGDGLVGLVIAAAKPLGLMAAAHYYPWEQASTARTATRTKQGPPSVSKARKAPAAAQTAPALRAPSAQAPEHGALDARAIEVDAPRKMTPVERQAEILRMVEAAPDIERKDIMSALGVGKDTVRRDLEALGITLTEPGDRRAA